MARQQCKSAFAWKEISSTDLGFGMGSANRIAHFSGYNGALEAASHRVKAPVMVFHAEMFLFQLPRLQAVYECREQRSACKEAHREK